MTVNRKIDIQNRQPMVSVIVPVYNVEKYLRQCLESIINQTLVDLEIICINDGSVDSSYDILCEYANKDDRIQVRSKQNEGLGGASARNLGLEMASGKYVSILDSDDFFDLSMLEKAVIRAEETNADIVVFGGFEYDDRTHTKMETIGILDKKYIPQKQVFSCEDCAETIYQLSQGMAWNKLYRKSFLDKYGIQFQKIKYTDDAFFTFAHMALADRITVIKEPLINYRINSGRNQTNGISNYPDSSYLPYIKLKEFLVEWDKYNLVKKSFINCVVGFLRYCYEKIDRYDAFVYLHNKLREEVFDQLDLTDISLSYYYDKRMGIWVKQVLSYDSGEILFESSRAHGSMDSTTGILRFRFPYENIPANSKIVIIGSRIAGQHYYSQAILSGLYDVVKWVDYDNPRGFYSIKSYDELKDVDFDYVLVVYYEKDKIEKAVSFLNSIDVFENKIIVTEDYL